MYQDDYNQYTNPNPTQYQVDAQQVPEKKKSGIGAKAIVALCLVCALLGGCVSGGLFAWLSRGGSAASSSVSGSDSTIQVSDRSDATVNTVSVPAGEEMSVSQIYNEYSGSVVSIQVSTQSGIGAGTGFVISEDGYILTCYHVVSGAQAISCSFSDSTSYEATYVGGDEDQDVAVLKIDATGLKPVVLGNSDSLNVGDTVTTIGNALGTLANTTTTGVVSALDRAVEMSDGTVINVLQTDCTVNSGNSGGPLFNAYGEVIGIVNAKYSSGSGYTTSATIEGIGFSIPIDDALDILDDLIQHGYVTGKPYLGISVSTVSSVTAQQYSNYVVGALVNSVASGSCAETAGLQVGDIITAADGTEITTYEELIDAKNSHKAGEVMELTVFRDGSYVTLAVTLDEEVPDASSTPGSSSQDDSAQQDENIYGGQQDGSSQGGSSRGGTYSFPFGGGFGGLW